MAIVPMQDAVAGDLALAAEYNNVTANVRDLDARVIANSSAINTANTNISTLESRTTDSSTGNVALGNRVTNLEVLKLPGAYFGQWTDNGSSTGWQKVDATSPDGEKLPIYNTAVGTPTGMTMSGGTVTVANAGLYLINASIQTVRNDATLIAMWIANSSGTSSAGMTKLGPTSGFRSDVLSSTAIVRLGANQPISVYAAVWQGTPGIDLWQAKGNVLTVAYLGA